MITLDGTFVRLVPLDASHADALLAAANEDRSTYAFTIVPHDADEMRQFIAIAQGEANRGVSVPFATIDRKSGKAVGSTRFMALDWWGPYLGPPPSKEGPPSGVEIGSTWLAASAQRSAVNSEAKLLMLRHAFETWKVERVTLKTDARNTRSRNAIMRLGAKEDGVLRAWQLASDGGPRDTAIYSILRSEWPAVRDRISVRR